MAVVSGFPQGNPRKPVRPVRSVAETELGGRVLFTEVFISWQAQHLPSWVRLLVSTLRHRLSMVNTHQIGSVLLFTNSFFPRP